jgi:hypothetical protein
MPDVDSLVLGCKQNTKKVGRVILLSALCLMLTHWCCAANRTPKSRMSHPTLNIIPDADSLVLRCCAALLYDTALQIEHQKSRMSHPTFNIIPDVDSLVLHCCAALLSLPKA